MPIEIAIPRLGWSADDAVFAGWLKKDGDAVKPGEMLFSLETEKAVEEIESLDAGILRIPAGGPKPGDRLTVGTAIGLLTQPGEAIAPAGETKRASVAVESAQPTAAASDPPIKRAASAEKRAGASSPRARRAAAELGVDWTGVKGTGRTGRVRERDVRAAATDPAPTDSATQRVIPITAVRRAIAERMLAGANATAPVTLTTTINADNLVNLREQFKAVAASGGDAAPGYTDFLVKFAAIALSDHPLLNARWTDEGIVLSPGVHIAIAVDTDAGLLAPVIRDARGLPLKQIAAQSRALAARARDRKLHADELQGATFTITNLGAFDIDYFTPIINYPQCAILGVGRIRLEAVAAGDRIVPGHRLTLSLTFDHRIVDGAPAARFLQSIARLVENPGPALVT